jgi:hypothetical protein
MAGRRPHRRIPRESSEQKELVRALRRSKLDHFAVPNGANVSDAERRKLVSEGMSAGVPDLIIPTAPLQPLDPRNPGSLTAAELEVAAAVLALLESVPDPNRILRAVAPRGLGLELKRQDGGAGLSPKQELWRRKILNDGWLFVEAHGCKDAVTQLRGLGFDI